MRKIGVFFAPGNHRSQLIARAMMAGIAKTGGGAGALRSSQQHRPGHPEFDVAIFYGLAGGLARLLADYRDSGRQAVYVDLGYWGRRKLSRWDGHHKLALNSRHPTAYFQRNPKGPTRFRQFRIEIAPWRKRGRHILLIGMSAKAAAAEGFAPEEWERDTVRQLRALTDRRIIYRPKPNWDGAKPIEGTEWGRAPELLRDALVGCHAVVTHHSNAAVDALLAGVPCVCPDGVASLLSAHQLADIENPPTPDGREQWAWDLAWTQWSVEEIERGDAWRYLDQEVLGC